MNIETIHIHSGEKKLMLLRNHDADMEVFIEEGASLKFFDSVNIISKEDEQGGTSSVSLTFHLMGPDAVLFMRGRVIGHKDDKIRRNILVEHCAGGGKSDIYYKYVLDDEAEGDFTGKVYVARDAQKTESIMLNRNLCLTKEAKMHSEPLLEIYADDVKCSHGSSIGMLDQDALFYMQQRGIALAEARQLLIDAFIKEIQIPSPHNS